MQRLLRVARLGDDGDPGRDQRVAHSQAHERGAVGPDELAGQVIADSRRALLRRLRSVMASEGLPNIRELGSRMREQPSFLSRVLDKLMLRVTSMFRDPAFFRLVRQRVAPLLRTYWKIPERQIDTSVVLARPPLEA